MVEDLSLLVCFREAILPLFIFMLWFPLIHSVSAKTKQTSHTEYVEENVTTVLCLC